MVFKSFRLPEPSRIKDLETRELFSEFIKTLRANFSSIEQALGSTSSTDFLSGFIEELATQDYRLVVKVPYGGTITETTTRSGSGSCTATFKINSTALGGTANSVSTSEQSQTHTTNNAFVAGDDIVLTISSNSSCLDMSFTIQFTRN